jgi:hypothetical protein
VSGIQFVPDEKRWKVGVLIEVKKYRAIWEELLGQC